MRILYVAFDDMSRKFAGTIHIREIVSRLRASGEIVAIASPRPSSPTEKWVGEWREIPVHGGPVGRRLRYLFGSLFALLAIVRTFRPDVIYCRGSHLNFSVSACSVLTKTPLVTEINGLIEEEVAGAAMKFTARLFQFLQLSVSKKIVTVSRLLQDTLVRRYGAPASKISVVPNGADPDAVGPIDRGAVRCRMGIRPETFTVVYAGSFYPGHSLDLLVDVISTLASENGRDIRAILIGEGVDRNRVAERTRTVGIADRVIFTGELNREEVIEYLSCADAGVLLSKGNRYVLASSPFKMYEYMSVAIPVIALIHSPEVAEFISKNEVGLVAMRSPSRRENIEAMARMIAELIDAPDARRRIGARGRRLVLDHYNWSRAAREVAEVIHAASRKS